MKRTRCVRNPTVNHMSVYVSVCYFYIMFIISVSFVCVLRCLHSFIFVVLLFCSFVLLLLFYCCWWCWCLLLVVVFAVGGGTDYVGVVGGVVVWVLSSQVSLYFEIM